MTVPNSTSRAEYDGNGAATDFAYNFKVFKDTDLRVSLLEGETEVVQTLDTDYTVTGVGDEAGGNVVFSTAPPSGKIVLIIRIIDITQNTDLRNQGAYLPETVEDELDRGRMIDQQMADDIRRSIRVPPGDDAGFDAELPRGIVGQANRAVITNDDGTGFEAGPTADEVTNAQQYSLDSLASSELAEKWANEAEDVEVVTGEFSSLHYSAKSSESASLSERWASEAEDVVVAGGAFSSLHYSLKASDEADRSTVEANRSRDEADRAQGVVDNTESYIGLIKDFHKADGSQPAWTAPTSSTLETASALALVVGSTVVEIASGTPVTLPTLAAGTDYTIYAADDGTLQAVDADSAAPAGERVVGGFHVSAGGTAIVSNSLWDLNWRPKSNPRAMVLDPGGTVWGDIYLTDVQYTNNGYSRNGQTIADDGNRPILPATVGGDGTAVCPSASWWQFLDIFAAAGKRYAIYEELVSLAYGVVERQAVGTDPVTTQHQAGHRSACGMEQATGVMWQWFSGASATGGSGWVNIAEGRGDVYASNLKAPLFGAHWNDGTSAGSRASRWVNAPDLSGSLYGARAVSDHLNLQAER